MFNVSSPKQLGWNRKQNISNLLCPFLFFSPFVLPFSSPLLCVTGHHHLNQRLGMSPCGTLPTAQTRQTPQTPPLWLLLSSFPSVIHFCISKAPKTKARLNRLDTDAPKNQTLFLVAGFLLQMIEQRTRAMPKSARTRSSWPSLVLKRKFSCFRSLWRTCAVE